VEQGAVRVGERKATSIDDVLAAQEIPADGVLLHAGKKQLKRIVVG
jgi:hypothetical protein